MRHGLLMAIVLTVGLWAAVLLANHPMPCLESVEILTSSGGIQSCLRGGRMLIEHLPNQTTVAHCVCDAGTR